MDTDALGTVCEFAEAHNITQQSMILLGKLGSGKSSILRDLEEHLWRQWSDWSQAAGKSSPETRSPIVPLISLSASDFIASLTDDARHSSKLVETILGRLGFTDIEVSLAVSFSTASHYSSMCQIEHLRTSGSPVLVMIDELECFVTDWKAEPNSVTSIWETQGLQVTSTLPLFISLSQSR